MWRHIFDTHASAAIRVARRWVRGKARRARGPYVAADQMGTPGCGRRSCQRVALTRLLGLHLEHRIERADPVGRLSHDGGVTARQDLPGYSGNQETEALGLLEVQRYLVTQGFKVTEVAGRFDDGLDLLLSPHGEKNVLPAIAGIQVRSGSSHRGLAVGRHERYWRELNLPVFGIVLTDPRR
jgi:hypothetical protein